MKDYVKTKFKNNIICWIDKVHTWF